MLRKYFEYIEMTLLEKIKVNLSYLLGEANPEQYSPKYKSSNLSLQDWQKRWEIFNADGTGFCVNQNEFN